ncbi:MAG: hypothetical protein BWY02_00436 [bacterium ADurb.Bin157]|nr:MAG: hypothetical protein BWY02_00436 [bacterium ADurb.Bin157]
MKSNINVLIKQTVSVVVIAFFLSLQGQTYAQNILVEPNGNITQADPSALGQRITHEQISSKLAMQIQRLVEAVYKIRSLAENPNDDNALFAMQRVAKFCGEIIGFTNMPNQTRFSSKNDRNIVRRKDGIIEFNNHGSFDNKVQGFIQPLSGVVYTELVFIGPGNRKIVLRGHLTRQYSLTGTFAVETWNNKGLCWKTQCTFDSILVAKTPLPVSGSLIVGGVDPYRRIGEKKLGFPVTIFK